jgi:hypothetical protein
MNAANEGGNHGGSRSQWDFRAAVEAPWAVVAGADQCDSIARIDHFAGNIAATMTEAVLSKVDLPPKDVLANLRNLRAEVRTLGNALGQVKSGEDPVLQFEIARLREALTVLNVSVDRLGNARSILTDEAIGQLGRTITDSLMNLRDCSSNVGQMASHHAPRSRTGEAWEGSKANTPALLRSSMTQIHPE